MIDPQDFMDANHIDVTPEETATVTSCIEQAEILISGSIDSSITLETYEADPKFVGAVKALATEFYFDRVLSRGLPIGVLIYIRQLKGKYLGGLNGTQ